MTPRNAHAILSPILLFGLFLAASCLHAAGPGPIGKALSLPNGSLMLEEGGRARIARNPDKPMVPASTMKIPTALAAIERWGLDHRFHTDFLTASDGWLWVKGHGDPYLVSEELDLIARRLRDKGLGPVKGIGTDDSLFAPDLEIGGRSSSNNPYDAPVTALAANFNTVHLVIKGGSVRSAESQTQITPLARDLGRRLGPGRHRVNLQERGPALRYFGELLGAKLKAAGISVRPDLRTGSVPTGARRIYRHRNSRDLRLVLASMLEYSNNFIANSLFLLLGDQGDGRPLTMPLAQRVAMDWGARSFGWRGHRIDDGAGLSRRNRLSARQLLDAVKAFAPYRDLLPAQNSRVKAKTGTLRGVSCYAGFVKRNGRWEPFSLLINQPVAYNLRLQVADALARTPNIARYCPGSSC